MKKLLIFVVSITLYSCASAPIDSAINITTHSGNGSIGVVDNSVSETKVGEAACHSILGIVAFGDCSVKAAKQNGGISKVNSVDNATLNIFYFYGQYKTIVRGE
jgi:hypothetical protein